jgi:hypothetical protein
MHPPHLTLTRRKKGNHQNPTKLLFINTPLIWKKMYKGSKNKGEFKGPKLGMKNSSRSWIVEVGSGGDFYAED